MKRWFQYDQQKGYLQQSLPDENWRAVQQRCGCHRTYWGLKGVVTTTCAVSALPYLRWRLWELHSSVMQRCVVSWTGDQPAHLLRYTHSYPKDIRLQETTDIYLVASTDWIKGTRGSTVGFCATRRWTFSFHYTYEILVAKRLLASQGQRFMDSVNTSIFQQVGISCT